MGVQVSTNGPKSHSPPKSLCQMLKGKSSDSELLWVYSEMCENLDK